MNLHFPQKTSNHKSSLCTPRPWDPVLYTHLRECTPDNVEEYMYHNEANTLLNDECALSGPNRFAVVGIVELPPSKVPGLEHPVTSNAYVLTTEEKTPKVSNLELTALFEKTCETNAKMFPAYADRFRDENRYNTAMSFTLVSILGDMAYAALEQRQLRSQPEGINKLLPSAFRMFTGIVCLATMDEKDLITTHEVIPLGVRPGFRT